MITKKLRNARKDLTETRNNTRDVKEACAGISSDLSKVSRKMISRKAYREMLSEELMRRDIWARAEAETKRLSRGRPVWAIKCPEYVTWLNNRMPFRGDYAYCMTIKKYLEREGIYAVLQLYDDWYCDIGAEVEIAMGIRREYHPDRRVSGRTNVMWYVSHPENESYDIIDRYDLVFVDSGPLAEKMSGNTLAKVEPLIVPADTDIFYRDDRPVEYERVFVGHTRGINRDCVRWCSENKIELDVWGSGWEKFYKDDPYIHLHGPVNYDETADIYRRSKIILNDHYSEMREVGMVNNRCPEVLLCGKPLVCDWSQGVENEFGDLFTYYHGEEDFVDAIRRAEERYDRVCEEIDRRYDELVEKYSFASGIKKMIKIVEQTAKEQAAGE